MSVSRRRFLRTGAVVSAALVLKPSTFVFGNHPLTPSTGIYSREMFEPYVGDTFSVRVGKQVVDLKLLALTDVKSANTDCFSMRFQAAKSLSASVHTLNHHKLGNFDLFMVQSDDGSKFMQTAIVNNLV